MASDGGWLKVLRLQRELAEVAEEELSGLAAELERLVESARQEVSRYTAPLTDRKRAEARVAAILASSTGGAAPESEPAAERPEFFLAVSSLEKPSLFTALAAWLPWVHCLPNVFPGDVWFVLGGRVHYLVERKRFYELNDHPRLKSQRARLFLFARQQGLPPARVCILVEAQGPRSLALHDARRRRPLSAGGRRAYEASFTHKEGFSCRQTENLAVTALLLVADARAIARQAGKRPRVPEGTDTATTMTAAAEAAVAVSELRLRTAAGTYAQASAPVRPTDANLDDATRMHNHLKQCLVGPQAAAALVLHFEGRWSNLSGAAAAECARLRTTGTEEDEGGILRGLAAWLREKSVYKVPFRTAAGKTGTRRQRISEKQALLLARDLMVVS